MSRSVLVAAALVLPAGASALARQATDPARPAAGGSAPVSSGEVVTGLAKPNNNPQARVGPGQPAPAEHVTQPSDKLKSDPNVTKEQVAPIPNKPVPPGTTRTNGNPGG